MALVVKADRQIRQTKGRSPAGQTDTQCSGEGDRDYGDTHRANSLYLYSSEMGEDLQVRYVKPAGDNLIPLINVLQPCILPALPAAQLE